MTMNPFARGARAGNDDNAIAGGTNVYYRRVKVTNIM